MEIDLYTFASFILGVLAGCAGGVWLSGLITSHKVERLEQKIHTLSDSKFQLKRQRVRLRQLEQRLDAEAASIPLAERELLEKTGEIRELTTALTETTTLTGELADVLRSRKLKVKQLQAEQAKWIARNEALTLKTELVEGKAASMQKDISMQRAANDKLDTRASQQRPLKSPAKTAGEAFTGKATAASPSLAASHHQNNGDTKPADDGSVDRLTSRMQKMESELQNWFDRVGKLEAGATKPHKQASGLAMLEDVLRSEADKQNAVTREDTLKLLGGRSAS